MTGGALSAIVPWISKIESAPAPAEPTEPIRQRGSDSADPATQIRARRSLVAPNDRGGQRDARLEDLNLHSTRSVRVLSQEALPSLNRGAEGP